MSLRRRFPALFILVWSVAAVAATPNPGKPAPDAKFQNWLYRTPDAATWHAATTDAGLVFSVAVPDGQFCTLTLFSGQPAQADFAAQFNQAIAADQAAHGTKVDADSGAKPSQAAEGYPVLTRSLRSGPTNHMYVAGLSGGRFNLAAFQASSDALWAQYGAQASQFLLSLKAASALSAAEVARLVPAAAGAPPTLPGMDDLMPAAAPAANPPATAAIAAPKPAAPVPAPAAAAPAPVADIPELPLQRSSLVVNGAVQQKDGKPIDGLKLSTHNIEIASPSIVVAADGVIHIAFMEKNKASPYAPSIYYRASSDNGKTWTETKNLSEDMVGIPVGRCTILADRGNRIYVVWRTAEAPTFPVSTYAGGTGESNLVCRVLDHGRWSKIFPLHPPGTAEHQDAGTLSSFATTDAAGRVQVLWNAKPEPWHSELARISGQYRFSYPGVGAGLVFQVTLDGASATAPREVFLSPVGGLGTQSPGPDCDGLDALNGFVDADGSAHFLAQITRTRDSSLSHRSVFELVEHAKPGPLLELPDLSFHGWNDAPVLLVDAAGRRHAIALFFGGERHNIRDYVLGSDDEPTVIRAVGQPGGSIRGFQAFQGPGGRMVALMEINDTGPYEGGDLFVSVSRGQGWSLPVNVTNNDARKKFASRQSGAMGVAVGTSYNPGPAACAFDRSGHLLLLMINNEFSLFGTTAFGVVTSSGNSSTPTLQFLRL